MAAPKTTLWKIESHTQAKHDILRWYLGAWFPILGRYHEHLLYIDGFCGPGRYQEGEKGSPIVALEEAIKQNSLQNNELFFYFVDAEEDRIEQLKYEIQTMSVTSPDNFKIYSITDTFENQFQIILNQMERYQKIIPAFAFIDPFGFKSTPFHLIQQFLEKPKTEIFINIMVDFMNRFLTLDNAKTQQHIIDLFGTPTALDIAQNEENRTEALRLLYKEQLEKHAKFVRYFEMRNKNDRIIYYLFFATNSSKGHEKMKDAFWKADSSHGFKFSDAANPNQLTLFEPGQHVPSMLAEELQYRFKNQRVTTQVIKEFVGNNTSFMVSHTTKALQFLEDNNKIRVDKLRTDSKKRRKSSFPNGVTVTFTCSEFIQPSLI